VKGVIMKVGEQKSVVLFTNGKFGSIPTPKNAQAGMVIHISYNRKRIAFFAVIAALVLAALLAGVCSFFFNTVGYREAGKGIQNGRFIEKNQHGHSGCGEDGHD
jgi:hypothetical protein